MLQRYDYAEVYDLLQPYFISENSNFGAVPNLLKAGIAWNQGQFERFLSLARSSMTIPGQIDKTFWWMAYEQAYLGTIRLEQQNTTEALLHSHRAVEGALYAWAIASFPNYVTTRQNQFPDFQNSRKSELFLVSTRVAFNRYSNAQPFKGIVIIPGLSKKVFKDG